MTLVSRGADMVGKISHEDFVIFRDFICEKTGVRIRDSRADYLEYRLQDRMAANGIPDYREYYYRLKYDTGKDSELQELINLITIRETSFFRHPDQLQTFSSIILRRIVEEKKKTGDQNLKIWSAACATGEEPLTIAMIIREDYPEIRDWPVSITATDISTSALDMAREGVYGENAFRQPLAGYKMRYFRKKGRHYHVNDDIKRMIVYRHVNLSDTESLGSYRGMDAIVCRNVFIYFPDEARNRIASKFWNLLSGGGFLILGNAETIDVVKTPFRIEFHKGGPIYIK